MGLIVGIRDFKTRRIRPYGIEYIKYSELRKGDVFVVHNRHVGQCYCKAADNAVKNPDGTIRVPHKFAVTLILNKDSFEEVSTYGKRD